MFETGTNRWRTFDAWPPQHAAATTLYLRRAGGCSVDVADAGRGGGLRRVRQRSASPVPYVGHVRSGMHARLHDRGPALRGHAARRAGLHDAAARRRPDRRSDRFGVDLHVSTTGTDCGLRRQGDRRVIRRTIRRRSGQGPSATSRPIACGWAAISNSCAANRSAASSATSFEEPVAFVPNQPDASASTCPTWPHVPPRPSHDGADPELVVPAHRPQPADVHRHPEGAARRFHHRHRTRLSQPRGAPRRSRFQLNDAKSAAPPPCPGGPT